MTETATLSVTEQLDKLFAPWASTSAPGLVVGIALRGATIYRRGFGMASLETATANTPATKMRIGSTSKHFTCLLALLLAEEGKLSIDAPIRAYLPELVGSAGEPTLRQLMQHVGGARCHLDLGFIGHGMAIPPLGTRLACLAAQTGRNFAPGKAMIYNNGGYHLLSLAIERVGGAPFERQLKDRLFDPLGMADTVSVPSDHAITPGAATLHVPAPDGGWRRGIFPSDELRGEGGILSTVDDMIRWMAHLRTRDRVGGAESWAAMVTPPAFPDGIKGMYALGLMLEHYRGLRTIHHAGGAVGGTCQMLTLPEDGLDVIVMANGAPGARVDRLAEQVVDIVLADRGGSAPVPVVASDRPALVGHWHSAETGMLYSVIEQDGVLKLAFGMGQVGLDLRPAADDTFIVPAASLGEIGLLLDGDDRLAIRFGGAVAWYERVTVADDGPSALSLAAAGRYRNAETDATAVIRLNEDVLKLSLSDGVGRSDLALAILGRDVLAPVGDGILATFGASLQLAVEGNGVSGFQVNTMRTRGLRFERIP